MTRVSNPIREEDVKAECERRILNRYPFSKQHNIQRSGTPEQIREMDQFINAMIQASNDLDRNPPIPHDFKSDQYWPTPTTIDNTEEVQTDD